MDTPEIKDALTGPSPCDECTLFDVCRDQRIACVDYGVWVIEGRVQHSVREPTADLMRLAETQESINALANAGKLGRPAKLSAAHILQIFRARGKKAQGVLAAKYGVSKTLIGEIHRGERHSDVTGHFAT